MNWDLKLGQCEYKTFILTTILNNSSKGNKNNNTYKNKIIVSNV